MLSIVEANSVVSNVYFLCVWSTLNLVGGIQKGNKEGEEPFCDAFF